MKKFRAIWLAIVIVVTVAFAVYRFIEIRRTDPSGPVFSCEQDVLEISIQDGEEVLLQGITASDRKDGDVTDSILVEKLSNLYDGNRRMVTYVAFDSDNHVSEMEREIVYTDYTHPHFELTGSLRYRSGAVINVDEIIKATDCLDGDLSSKVKIHMETTINNRVTGFYPIEYEVTNSAGDTVRLPLEVEVYQAEAGEVTLNLDQYLVYYEGTSINYKDYLRSVQYGSTEIPFVETDLETGLDPEEGTEVQTQGVGGTTVPLSYVSVRSDVKTDTPGVYPVYFSYYEAQGQITYEATEVMYVVVE